MSVEGDLQHSLRIGDTVLLYSKEARGYVFSELSRSVLEKVVVSSVGDQLPYLPQFPPQLSGHHVIHWRQYISRAKFY